MQHLLEPLVVSWGWNRDQTGPVFETGPVFVQKQEWQGTRDPAAYLAVPAAIQFQADHDWSRVREKCHELLREARRGMEELTGLPPLCPDSREWYAQMASFPLPACDGAAIQRRLYDEYRVEVPVIEWNGRQLVRVSVQGYSAAEDLKALVGALSALLPRWIPQGIPAPESRGP